MSARDTTPTLAALAALLLLVCATPAARAGDDPPAEDVSAAAPADDEADDATMEDAADDDDPPDGEDADDETLDDEGDGAGLTWEGLARVGWRLLSGRGRGRFLEDVGLDDGPSIVDLEIRGTDEREGAAFDTLSAEAHDLGERSSDARVRLRRSGRLALEGGWMRDLYSYRADGDPFPRDSVRERMDARLVGTPRRGLTWRVAWDRSSRRGSGYAMTDTNLRELPAPPGVDADLVATRRPFRETFDTLSAGVDVTTGAWRLGLSLDGRRGLADDERFYDIPAAKRGPDPVREAFRRRSHVEGGDAVLKVGRTDFDGALETTLVVTRGRHPVDADIGGSADGFDNALEGPLARGAFRSATVGDTDLERDRTAWELEAVWHADADVDVVATTGQDDVVDDARLDLVETRRYDRPDVATERLVTHQEGRTTNRADRWALEGLWQIVDDVRVRAGHEWYRQDVNAPFETRGDSLDGSELRSMTTRWVAGVDVDPAPGVSVSVLARLARNDDPPATPSAETADDVIGRARWRVSEEWTLSAVHRERGVDQDERFDSVSRSRSSSLSAAWARGDWSVDATVTRQTIGTQADTTFFLLDSTGFRKVADTIDYSTRDLVGSLRVAWQARRDWRLVGGGEAVRSTGDVDLRSYALFAGVELELREDLAAGATVRTWRYDERGRDVDDYDADALELWLEYRFR